MSALYLDKPLKGGPRFKSLMSWALGRYRGLQAGLLLAVLAAVVCRVFPVEMQKRVVNEAIALQREDDLFLYCGLYLGAVLIAAGLKFLINVLQGYIGQKILLEIRQRLFEHMLRLPLSFYRRTSAGAAVNAVSGELAVAGEFLGAAIAVPAINVLTLAAFAGYMIWLNPLLAGLALVVYPAEMVILPRLQLRLNKLNRKRVDETRRMSGVIVEAVDGMHEIHAYAAHALEAGKFEDSARAVYRLRKKMNLYNFGVKLVNNVFQKVGPFLLFLVGGWLAIRGEFSLGELVAFIGAMDNLYDPWKELMDYYQLHQDANTRYERILDSFDAPQEFRVGEGEPVARLPGELEVRGLSFTAEGGSKILEDAAFSLKPGERAALVGFSGSGKSTLALSVGQLQKYDGHAQLGGREIKDLSKLDMAANVAVVAQAPFIFSGTLRENLLYGVEAMRRARPQDDIPLPSRQELLSMVRKVGLYPDTLRFGLSARLPEGAPPELQERLVAVRKALRLSFAAELDEIVETYETDHYLRHADVLRNILFCETRRKDFQLDTAAHNPAFLHFLERKGLKVLLEKLGFDLARRTVRLLGSVADDAFFFQGSPIQPDELQDYVDMLDRVGPSQERAEGEDLRLALKLALAYVPARHAMLSLPGEIEQAALRARLDFMIEFGGGSAAACELGPAYAFPPAGQPDQPAQAGVAPSKDFVFYCMGQYIPPLTLLDNLLFGRIREERAKAQERAQLLAVNALEEAGLIDEVLWLGLDFQVGAKGDRLSGGQKQKTAIARALIKKPALLIMDEATASLDNASQAGIQKLLDEELRGAFSVLAVVHRLDLVKDYDKIMVLKAGHVIEEGTWDELMSRDSAFKRLAGGGG